MYGTSTEYFVLHYQHFVPFVLYSVLLPYHMRPDAPTRAGPVGCTLHCSRGPEHASLFGPGPRRSPGPGVRTRFIQSQLDIARHFRPDSPPRGQGPLSSPSIRLRTAIRRPVRSALSVSGKHAHWSGSASPIVRRLLDWTDCAPYPVRQVLSNYPASPLKGKPNISLCPLYSLPAVQPSPAGLLPSCQVGRPVPPESSRNRNPPRPRSQIWSSPQPPESICQSCVPNRPLSSLLSFSPSPLPERRLALYRPPLPSYWPLLAVADRPLRSSGVQGHIDSLPRVVVVVGYTVP